MTTAATDANFAETISTGKPVLIDFWAAWCGPCKQIAPTIDAIAAERDDVTVVKVDIDQAPATAQQYDIRSVPTLVVLNADGTMSSRSGIAARAAIEKMIDEAA